MDVSSWKVATRRFPVIMNRNGWIKRNRNQIMIWVDLGPVFRLKSCYDLIWARFLKIMIWFDLSPSFRLKSWFDLTRRKQVRNFNFEWDKFVSRRFDLIWICPTLMIFKNLTIKTYGHLFVAFDPRVKWLISTSNSSKQLTPFAPGEQSCLTK